MIKGQSHMRAHGPDWADVCVLITEIERIYRVLITIYPRPRGGVNNQGAMMWVVRTSPLHTPTRFQQGLEESKQFPSRDHATVEGLLFHLLHRVDGRLAARRAEAERQRPMFPDTAE